MSRFPHNTSFTKLEGRKTIEKNFDWKLEFGMNFWSNSPTRRFDRDVIVAPADDDYALNWLPPTRLFLSFGTELPSEKSLVRVG